MAALPPAGVSLQAQGFSEYIKRLDQINKAQQEIFNVTSQKTGRTVEQVAKKYKGFQREVEKAAAAQKKAADEAKSLAAAQKTAAATQRQAFISTTQAIVNMVKQVAVAAFELGKLGAQFQGQQVGLNNLAANFGQSGKAIQKAIQDASKGTLSGLDAIQAANQGLLLGVAQTPEEFARLTNAALTLGRTLGIKSTQAIEQFTSALGRRSLLILDNFGISAKQVNAEIERLARADFGKARSELTEAQKQATFMKAALNVASQAATTIGDEAGEAQAAFDRLTASSEDFKTELGIAISNLNETLGITDAITRQINQATEAFKVLRGTGAEATLDEQIEATEIKIKNLQETFEATQKGLAEGGGLFGTGLLEGFLASLDESAVKSQTDAIAELQAKLDELNLEKAAEDAKKFGDATDDTTLAVEDNTKAIQALESALRQAQALQLSFAREAEDAALKQARAAEDLARKRAAQDEDIARKQARDIAKLGERQARDRDRLLKNQAKELDKFEKDRRKQLAKAEDDIKKERQKANNKRIEDQKKLQRELQQAQDRFNLSRLQSERRFTLSETRLRAEGDILALQRLREDRELERQEEKENFDLSQKERIQDASEKKKIEEKDFKERINELKTDLEDRRKELLSSFDEQLAEQQESQVEARRQQQMAFQEQAQDRAIALQREEETRKIALQREEEDRRRSQARQLEDLGRSLAEQKDVTAQGVTAIAGEIEKIFGMEGVADNIFTGFSERTKSEFNDLIENVEDTFRKLQGKAREMDTPLVGLTGAPNIPESPLFLPGFSEPRSFGDGGVVPGPIGSPQIIQAHAGETVLPTHQQSFTMAAPVIPSQSLDVNMSGGFNITGDGQGNDEILQAASREMTENFKIAIRRLARRN